MILMTYFKVLFCHIGISISQNLVGVSLRLQSLVEFLEGELLVIDLGNRSSQISLQLGFLVLKFLPFHLQLADHTLRFLPSHIHTPYHPLHLITKPLHLST